MSGDLPPNWMAETLEGVAEVHDDLREPVNAEERKGRVGPYPYYGATGQVGWIDDFLMDGEYVLLGEDGAPFLDPSRDKAYLVSGKSWVNNHAHVLRGIDGVCRNRFLLHALNHADYRGFANGTTRLKLTQAAMRRLPIRLPPPGEQDRIVAKIEELFSDLDAGVAALERVRANLKRYRAAVLKAAVEGRLTEEWRTQHPATEPAAKLLERILADRRAKWEQDQLRKFKEAGKTPAKGWKEKYDEPDGPVATPEVELPSSWTWAIADQLCGTITDGEHITPPRTDSGVYLLSARNVIDGRLRFDEVDYVSPETHSLLCRRLRIVAGDVLMSCSGSVGRSCVAPEGLDFSLVRSVAVLKPVMPIGDFMSIAIRSILLQHQVSEKKSQTAQANIFQGKIKRLVFPLPPLAEQSAIVAEVDRRLSVADAAEQQVEHALQRAARLRQSILKRAFEGKLVPQDPTDEPAAALLDRMKAAGGEGSNGHLASVRKKDSSAATPAKRRSRARA